MLCLFLNVVIDIRKSANYWSYVKSMEKVNIISALETKNLINLAFAPTNLRFYALVMIRLWPWRTVHHCIVYFWIFPKLLTVFSMRGYC